MIDNQRIMRNCLEMAGVGGGGGGGQIIHEAKYTALHNFSNICSVVCWYKQCFLQSWQCPVCL